MRRIERPKSLVDMATHAIREQIVSGDLPLGEKISEGRIAELLGLSTTPVREAFQTLAQEGLVNIIAQKGTFVFDLTPGDLNQLCEARLAIEPIALQLACERAHTALSRDLGAIVAEMQLRLAANDIKAYIALDSRFHQAILKHCGNAYLQRAYDLIGWKVSALRFRLGSDPGHIAKSLNEHQLIASHVESRDVDAALAVLPRHIARKEGSYWEHLDQKYSSLMLAATS